MFSIAKSFLPLLLAATAIAVLLGLGHQVQVLYILILVFVSAVRWGKLTEMGPRQAMAGRPVRCTRVPGERGTDQRLGTDFRW